MCVCVWSFCVCECVHSLMAGQIVPNCMRKKLPLNIFIFIKKTLTRPWRAHPLHTFSLIYLENYFVIFFTFKHCLSTPPLQISVSADSLLPVSLEVLWRNFHSLHTPTHICSHIPLLPTATWDQLALFFPKTNSSAFADIPSFHTNPHVSPHWLPILYPLFLNLNKIASFASFNLVLQTLPMCFWILVGLSPLVLSFPVCKEHFIQFWLLSIQHIT